MSNQQADVALTDRIVAAPFAPMQTSLAPAKPTLFARSLGLRFGIVPVPIAILVLGLVAAFSGTGIVPSDILLNIALLTTGGFICAEIGQRIPVLGGMGFGAILATFLPSYLVYLRVVPANVAKSISAFTDATNFLYLFVATIVVGSILSIDRKLLLTGLVKICVPLIAGSVAATAIGCSVGILVGLDFEQALFKVVVPIMAGGVGEGAIPLSIGYASAMHGVEGDYFAEVLPAVMLGSLTAILLAGGLNVIGRKYPALTGEGRLQPEEYETAALENVEPMRKPAAEIIGAALIMTVTLYLLGVLAQRLWGWPAPVVMLGLVVLIKIGRLVSPDMEAGAHVNYLFFKTCVTYPLLFAIGVSKTPWEKLAAAFNAPTLLTIVSTVTTLVGVGFLTGRLVRLYPVEAAIVNACHAGQGVASGGVGILTAANRMQLMPFAQIAVRIGGGVTVAVALIAFRYLHS